MLWGGATHADLGRPGRDFPGNPQQIAGRLPIEHPADQHVRVSHEAIYGWTYALPKGELARQCLTLRSGRTRRRPAHGRAPRAPRISGIRWIDERPADAADRRVPGRWEGGLVAGKDGRTAMATPVERVSRFVVLMPPTGRDATTVSEAVIDQVKGLPDVLRRSLTRDRGSETANHAAITLKARLPVYFAHPHSPGSTEPTRTPTAGYGNISPKAPPSQATRTISRPSPTSSTTAPRHLRIQEAQESVAELLASGIASTDREQGHHRGGAFGRR
nr:IS30 family transposase [Actinomadura geliboluensis]